MAGDSYWQEVPVSVFPFFRESEIEELERKRGIKGKSQPDKPVKSPTSVTYNQNTVTADTIINSPIQQSGGHASPTQTVTYSSEDLHDLRRLVDVFENHLDDLALDEAAQRKGRAQIATIKAQLEDEPDPVIVKQAGRTLQNITEGAIGSLLASAAQPVVWALAASTMARLFGGS